MKIRIINKSDPMEWTTATIQDEETLIKIMLDWGYELHFWRLIEGGDIASYSSYTNRWEGIRTGTVSFLQYSLTFVKNNNLVENKKKEKSHFNENMKNTFSNARSLLINLE